MNGLKADQIIIDEIAFLENPYSTSEQITQVKGWRFTKEENFSWDLISIHGFLCSKNWSMGSVIASGFEIFIEIGYWRIDYLNRYVIKPPKLIVSSDRHTPVSVKGSHV
jgi:hypothetical protein